MHGHMLSWHSCMLERIRYSGHMRAHDENFYPEPVRLTDLEPPLHSTSTWKYGISCFKEPTHSIPLPQPSTWIISKSRTGPLYSISGPQPDTPLFFLCLGFPLVVHNRWKIYPFYSLSKYLELIYCLSVSSSCSLLFPNFGLLITHIMIFSRK